MHIKSQTDILHTHIYVVRVRTYKPDNGKRLMHILKIHHFRGRFSHYKIYVGITHTNFELLKTWMDGCINNVS